MKTIKTEEYPYHPLIVATEFYYKAKHKEELEIRLANRQDFKAFKDFLVSKKIGFREVYMDTSYIIQFTKYINGRLN